MHVFIKSYMAVGFLFITLSTILALCILYEILVEIYYKIKEIYEKRRRK